MSQEALDWQSILKTAATFLSLAGGFTAFLFGQRLKIRDERIQDLRTGKSELIAKLGTAKEIIKELQATVTGLLNDQGEDLSPQAIGVLNSILSKLQIDEADQSAAEDGKIAALWLQRHQKRLMRSAIKDTMRSHKHLIPKSELSSFKENIEECMKWVCECLSFYGHPDVPLAKYVKHRALDSAAPYTHAIKCIQSFDDMKRLDKRKKLTQQQSIYLKGMLDELILKIPSLFS